MSNSIVVANFNQLVAQALIDEGISQGPAGVDGTNGTNGTDGVAGTNGVDGIDGTNGLQGPAGYSGTDGIDGINGTTTVVSSIVSNPDNTITITFSDGTVHTTPVLKGDVGATGATGATGSVGPTGSAGVDGYNGIDGDSILLDAVTNNPDGTIQMDFSDGTVHTTPVLMGTTGATGATGKGIVDTILLSDLGPGLSKTYIMNYTDGTFDTMNFLNGDSAQEGGGDYIRMIPVQHGVGGISAGTTFTGTIGDALDKLLYPFVEPTFTVFTVPGLVDQEVGSTLSLGTVAATWATSSSETVAVDAISITDVTNSNTLTSAEANDSTADIVLPDYTYTAVTTQQFKISGTSTEGNAFSRTTSADWLYMIYYGESASTTMTENEIEALRVGTLAKTPGATYVMAAGDYKWICYPTSMGLKSTFKDAQSGFDVAMNPVETIEVVNQYGVATDYYAHRSYNSLGGGISIAVS